MPNVNGYLADPNLFPSRTGQGRSVVDIPSQPLSGAPASFGQAEGQALAQLGEGMQTLGVGLARQQQAEALQRKAQDVNDAKKQLNTYTQQLDTYYYERLADTDYRQVPTVVRDYAGQLEHELSQSLSPQAAELFRGGSGERLNVVNRDAEQFRRTRLLSEGKATADNAQMLFVDGQLRARNEDDASQQTVQFLRTLQDLADVGIIPQSDIHPRFIKARDELTLKQSDLAATTEPEAFRKHLEALKAGGTGDPRFPEPPPGEWARLLDETDKHFDAHLRRREHGDREAARKVTTGQERNEATLLNLVTLATNADQLATLQREVQTRAVDYTSNGIKDEAQRRLFSAIEAQRTRIEQGVVSGARQTSDPAAKREWDITALSGQGQRTPQALQELQVQVLRDMRLTPTDAGQVAKELQRELDASHVSKLTGYSDAEQLLNSSFRQSPFDNTDEEHVRQEVAARQAFRDQLNALVQTKGRTTAELAIPQLVDQVILDFNTRIMRKVRDKLQLEPAMPPGLYRTQPDDTNLNDADIETRYLDGITKIRQAIKDEKMAPSQAYGYMALLDQRKKWETAYWQHLLKEGRGKPSTPTQAPAGPSWWERLNPFSGTPPAAPDITTPEGQRQRLQQEKRAKGIQ